jgi:capsular exopolysaccharide synthesis family protein
MADTTSQTLHFNEYFKVIRNRLWVIFTIFVLTVATGEYVTEWVLPKVYTASAEIQLHPAGEHSVVTIDNAPADKGFDPTAFQAEFEILQSPDMLQPIINDLQLDKIWAQRLYKGKLEKMQPLDALAYMNSILRLDLKRGTNIIQITVSSEVAQEAADIANAVADRYKTVRQVSEDQRNTRGEESLQEQIDQQQKVVDQKRAVLDKMREDAAANGVDLTQPGSGAGDRTETDLDERQKDLLSAKVDYDARRVLLEKVQNLPDDEFISTLDALGREESKIATLRTEVLGIDSDIDNLLKDGFEENHPRVLSLRAEKERKLQQIKDLIAATRRAMVVDADMAQSRVTLLQKEVDDLKTSTREHFTNSLEPYRMAQRDFDEQQSLLDALSVRLKQVSADKQLLESPVRIITRATAPNFPSKPNKNLNLTVSVMAGLFVGVVVAFLIEYLDTSVKTMADAESLLGLPVLTVIPNKGGPMPLNQEAARLPHAEGYRILRAKLDLKVQNGIGPSLSMLSGGPGEGKSTTIYNLAIVCAQAGQSVILVDCDLRRPTLHELVNLPNDRGLSNYLQGKGDAVEYIQQTAIPKLHLLASGDLPMSEIGVLAGDKIRMMLEDLKQRYDLVLVDSPPVLGISDGSIIAREVDYVILVIQHRRYPREISLRAKRAIEEVHGNCVGMVLNCVSVKSDDSYYYYSSYGNYYKKAGRNKKRKNVAANGNGDHKALTVGGRKADLESDEF